MAEQFVNGVSTTLASSMDNSQTTCSLTSATGFPATGTFRCRILAEGGNTDEIVTVTARSGTTLTIIRATEAYAGSQAASAHGSGATITVMLTAAGLLAAVTSGGGQLYLGYNSVGASWETLTVNRHLCKQFVLSSDSFVDTLDFYLRPSTDNVDGLYAEIMTDNSGAPGTLVAAGGLHIDDLYLSNSSSMPGAGRWVSVKVGAYLAAGTYWAGFTNGRGRFDVAYDTGGSDQYFTASLFIATGAYPSAWSITTGSRNYSIRISTIALGTASTFAQSPGTLIRSLLGTPDTAYDFDGTSLSGLTAMGSPTTEDANTSVPNNYYVRKSATSTYQWYGRYQSVTAPCTVVACLTDLSARADYTVAGMWIGVASPGNMDMVHFGRQGFDGNFERVTPTSFGGAIDSSFKSNMAPPIYIAIVAHSTSNVDYLWSMNGRIWTTIRAGRDPSITIGAAGIAIKSENSTWGMAAAFDFFYIYNSAKTLPTN